MRLADEQLAQSIKADLADRRRLKIALTVALVAHVVFFLISFPTFTREVHHPGRQARVFVMEQVRFQKKPPAKAEQPKQKIPEKKAKKIPIPDPTPDDPEPIEVLELDVPDLEPSDVDQVVFGIPDGPDPGSGPTGVGDFQGDAMQLGDGVSKPKVISKPWPPYTEDARLNRIQGVVLLTGIVDEVGDVQNLKVIKGLPLGLDEKAIETVSTWKYEPASFEGRPVAVHMTFSIGFWLQ